VQRDTKLAGHAVPAGDTVITFLGGANRDERRFEHPDRFDPTRADNQPLSFGFGIHHCLGAQLARAEGQEVFSALLNRFPSLELAETEPHWRPGITLRGLERLRIQV